MRLGPCSQERVSGDFVHIHGLSHAIGQERDDMCSRVQLLSETVTPSQFINRQRRVTLPNQLNDNDSARRHGRRVDGRCSTRQISVMSG